MAKGNGAWLLVTIGILFLLVLTTGISLAYDYVYVDNPDKEDYDIVFLRRPDVLNDNEPDFYVYERPSQTRYVHLRNDYWVETSWEEPPVRAAGYNYRNYDSRGSSGNSYDRYSRDYDTYSDYNRNYYDSNPIRDYYYDYSPYMRTVTKKECCHYPPRDSLFYIKCP